MNINDVFVGCDPDMLPEMSFVNLRKVAKFQAFAQFNLRRDTPKFVVKFEVIFRLIPLLHSDQYQDYFFESVGQFYPLILISRRSKMRSSNSQRDRFRDYTQSI